MSAGQWLTTSAAQRLKRSSRVCQRWLLKNCAASKEATDVLRRPEICEHITSRLSTWRRLTLLLPIIAFETMIPMFVRLFNFSVWFFYAFRWAGVKGLNDCVCLVKMTCQGLQKLCLKSLKMAKSLNIFYISQKLCQRFRRLVTLKI